MSTRQLRQALGAFWTGQKEPLIAYGSSGRHSACWQAARLWVVSLWQGLPGLQHQSGTHMRSTVVQAGYSYLIWLSTGAHAARC